jgi:D-alanyl-lipoteichoic acid acyltransferase DltB (MBOAT superfamily)
MLFDSPIYILSLCAVVVIYWRLNHSQQNTFLLLFSYFFYGWWDWRFLSLIWISTIVDFYCARLVERSSSLTKRRMLLTLSVGLNLLFLGFFKYFNFFADSLRAVLSTLGLDVSPTVLNVVLPPAISFYTFQAIAYMVDVYMGRLPATRSLRDYALFICLFPHLIAGPIQRPSHLLPQVQKPRVADYGPISQGVMLIVSGLFRKVVVAGQCALIADAAFSGAMGDSAAVVLLGAYAFAWQIYADFSGYSNIARGSAQLLGFHFMVNFRQPYLATSLQDFWRRWHISLSSWLRDYLYIALGGSKQGELKTYRNLFTTMLLGGLWHGANWTFVVWGALHGFGLSVERAFIRGRLGKVPSVWGTWIKRLLVFHFVCLSWIFFRAESISEAFDFLGGLTNWEWDPVYAPMSILLAGVALMLFIVDVLENRRDEEVLFERARTWLQYAATIAFACLLLTISANNSGAFIYFQF